MSHKSIMRISLENSVYFSFTSFLIILLASFLFDKLERGVGQLDIGVIIIIVLSLVLVLFSLALANILLSEHKEKVDLLDKLLSVMVFVLVSALILGLLGLLFFVPI